MENLFKKMSLPLDFPDLSGWYDTDKGNLYFFRSEKQWSCREDRVSEEYPKFWYQEIDVSELKPETKKLQKYEIHSWEREADMQPDSDGNYYQVEDVDMFITQLKQERNNNVESIKQKLTNIYDHIQKNVHFVNLNYILDQSKPE